MLQYKGDLKTRVRFCVEVCEAIKKACGQDFLIETSLKVSESPTGQNLWASTMAEAVQQAKMLEGLVDILAVGSVSVKGWTQDREPYPSHLRFSQAIKESGAKIAVAPFYGFQDLELSEEHIATGKADIIGMGNAWIADWEYGKKAYEGRGEDVVPCIRCDKCHGIDQKKGPWFSVCSVNPKLGIDTAVRMIDAPSVTKKVAVIGGGPAGMKAAMTAAERGHRVTLYEKNAFLGGVLRHSDFSPYKWPLMDFKNYLVRQVNKSGIEVLLNTAATPDMIKAGGYDTILIALGADPVIPRIPGANGKNVWNVVNVYGKEKELGKNVVLIGGGEIGAETGMYLARAGHNLTVLTSDKQLLSFKGPHQQDVIIGVYEKMDNFNIITEVTATGISDGKVTYKDASGKEKSAKADSVVIYAGFKPRQDEAMTFSGSAGQVFIIGDCSGIGEGVQKSQRSAFFAASQV
jgi:NADPH-dependent 2,4-dienoyl-CoA reductase/sulfur reductase-like enzyme